MPASALKNIHTLEAMCGVRAMRNVALVTTMWNEVPMEVAQRRERYLFEEFWFRMLRDGARSYRFKDSFKSAWEISDSLLQLPPSSVFMSEELVDHNRPLRETQAGIPLIGARPRMQRRLSNRIGQLFSRLLA